MYTIENGGRIDLAVWQQSDGEIIVLNEKDIDNLPTQCRKALQKELENDVLLELLPIESVELGINYGEHSKSQKSSTRTRQQHNDRKGEIL